MEKRKSPGIDVALIHYPVLNRTGEVIGSAVTNLDLHDIARAGMTYGIDTYWVVVPDKMQQELVATIISHWKEGYGGEANPDRKDALSLIRICSTLEEAVEQIKQKEGVTPYLLATCARPGQSTVEYAAVRDLASGDKKLLLLFGTAWGLAPEVLGMADAILPPLKGAGEYNHLSVRSAVSIILDRLLAIPDER